MKNVWKYVFLLGFLLMLVNLIILICLMPFYGWKETLPYWIEVLCKVWLILLFVGGLLGLVTHCKTITNEIKEMLEL